MKKLILMTTALGGLWSTSALAVPMCDGPRFDDKDGIHLSITFGFGRSTEDEAAQLAELLEYLHIKLRTLIAGVQLDKKGDHALLETRQWQAVLDIQSRLSEYLRQIGNPSE